MYMPLRSLGVLLLASLSCIAAPADKLPRLAPHEAVPNQYVVMLRPGITREFFQTTLGLVRNAMGANAELRREFFFSDFRGFSMEATPAVVEAIRLIPGIQEIGPNMIHHVIDPAEPATARRAAPASTHKRGKLLRKRIHQDNCTYGLDRLSHHTNGIKANRRYNFVYFNPAGQGTTVYVLDSGVYAAHEDFGGRVRFGANYAPPSPDGRNGDEDYVGHGTLVASCAAGFDYGIAKRANIVDVKVLNANNSATYESELSGITYAADDAEQQGREAVSVINMSFGGRDGQGSGIVKYAVRAAVRQGIFCVVSAGNQREPAEYYVPANVAEACTVGGTNDHDNVYYYTNYGQSVDIYAPGAEITGAGIGSPTALKTNYGTSFSAPYVSGIAAYLKGFGTRYTDYTPRGLCDHMKAAGSLNYINFPEEFNPPGPNIIAYDEGGAV